MFSYISAEQRVPRTTEKVSEALDIGPKSLPPIVRSVRSFCKKQGVAFDLGIAQGALKPVPPRARLTDANRLCSAKILRRSCGAGQEAVLVVEHLRRSEPRSCLIGRSDADGVADARKNERADQECPAVRVADKTRAREVISMAKQVRRIVTGHDARGRSVIISDSLVPPVPPKPGAPIRAGLWLTDTAPASNRGNEDAVPGGVIFKTAPEHRGGSVFRIAEILPDSQTRPSPEEMRQRGVDVTPDRSARHPGFHRTNTVDYAICLEGEIWAVLDEGETLMKAGDVLIQRGTFHAWSNRSDKPAVMAFILIDAEPAT